VVEDFNGDAILDLAVSDPRVGSVSILLGDGAGGFSAPTLFALGGVGGVPGDVGIGDFNGDTILDLAVPLTSGEVSILLGIPQ
jgi:hypothetical protein